MRRNLEAICTAERTVKLLRKIGTARSNNGSTHVVAGRGDPGYRLDFFCGGCGTFLVRHVLGQWTDHLHGLRGLLRLCIARRGLRMSLAGLRARPEEPAACGDTSTAHP